MASNSKSNQTHLTAHLEFWFSCHYRAPPNRPRLLHAVVLHRSIRAQFFPAGACKNQSPILSVPDAPAPLRASQKAGLPLWHIGRCVRSAASGARAFPMAAERLAARSEIAQRAARNQESPPRHFPPAFQAARAIL